MKRQKKILDYVELKYKQDKNYIYKKDKVDFLEKHIVYDRLKILAYEKNIKNYIIFIMKITMY